jgi:hypothetical protein
MIALLTFSQLAVAQHKDPEDPSQERKPFDREAFMTKRNAYIIEKMGLTEEESKTFIPLENELMDKKFELGRECHKLERELRKKEKEERSEGEYNKLLKCKEEVKEKRDRVDKEYLEKFKKVLTAEQIIKYQAADKSFWEEHMRKKGD